MPTNFRRRTEPSCLRLSTNDVLCRTHVAFRKDINSYTASLLSGWQKLNSGLAYG
jgi:hypothetical protein